MPGLPVNLNLEVFQKMNIVKIFPETASKKQRYDLTMSPKMQNMKLLKGSKLEVAAWCKYEDVDAKTGEVRPILSILSPEGEVFGTNSATFIGDFESMVDMFGEDGVDVIEVVSGTSKAGREFITCAYAGE